MSGRRQTGSSFPLVLEAAQARAIARRSKTQLRRLAGTVVLGDGRRVRRACGLHVANTYEVTPGQAAAALARIVITAVELQRLGSMTIADAQAEGHQSLTGFADWWLARHDRHWPPTEEQLCSNCQGLAEYVDHHERLVPCNAPGCDLGVVLRPVALGAAPRDTIGVAARWLEHAEREVWVVHFRLDDRRFMHRDSQRGYTSDPREAMRGEPEVIGDPLPVWRARGEALRRRDQGAMDDARLSGLPTIDDQLLELQRLAAERGVDLTRDRHVIGQQVEKAARKVGLTDEAA